MNKRQRKKRLKQAREWKLAEDLLRLKFEDNAALVSAFRALARQPGVKTVLTVESGGKKRFHRRLRFATLPI